MLLWLFLAWSPRDRKAGPVGGAGDPKWTTRAALDGGADRARERERESVRKREEEREGTASRNEEPAKGANCIFPYSIYMFLLPVTGTV